MAIPNLFRIDKETTVPVEAERKEEPEPEPPIAMYKAVFEMLLDGRCHYELYTDPPTWTLRKSGTTNSEGLALTSVATGIRAMHTPKKTMYYDAEGAPLYHTTSETGEA